MRTQLQAVDLDNGQDSLTRKPALHRQSLSFSRWATLRSRLLLKIECTVMDISWPASQGCNPAWKNCCCNSGAQRCRILHVAEHQHASESAHASCLAARPASGPATFLSLDSAPCICARSPVFAPPAAGCVVRELRLDLRQHITLICTFTPAEQAQEQAAVQCTNMCKRLSATDQCLLEIARPAAHGQPHVLTLRAPGTEIRASVIYNM